MDAIQLLSKGKEWDDILQEWHVVPGCEINGQDSDEVPCELCGSPLRYVYRMANSLTDGRLRVGLDCLVRYGLGEATDLRVSRDYAIARAKREISVAALQRLEQSIPGQGCVTLALSEMSSTPKMISPVFSPGQAASLAWECDRAGLAVEVVAAFKVNLKTKENQICLGLLDESDIARLSRLGWLSPLQIRQLGRYQDMARSASPGELEQLLENQDVAARAANRKGQLIRQARERKATLKLRSHGGKDRRPTSSAVLLSPTSDGYIPPRLRS